MRNKLVMLGIVLFGAGALIVSIVFGISAWQTLWPTLNTISKIAVAGGLLAGLGFCLIGAGLPPYHLISKTPRPPSAPRRRPPLGSPPFCVVGYCENAPLPGSFLCKTHGGVPRA